MAIQRLNFGTASNNDGEVLRTAFPKLDANDAELFERVETLENIGPADIADHVAAADPHTQYLNTTRGDARYYTQAQLDGFLADKLDVATYQANRVFALSDYGASTSASAATNTTAFQAAIDDAFTNGGGEIVLPCDGKISLSSTQIEIPKFSTTQQLIVRGSGKSSGFLLDSAAPIYVGDPVTVAGGAGVLFKDLSFSGASSSAGSAIEAENASALKFVRCAFHTIQDGVVSSGSYGVQFLDCFAVNVGRYLFDSSTDADGFRAIGGNFYNVGLTSSGVCFRIANDSDNVVVRDGTYENCYQILNLGSGCDSLIMEGNYIEYCDTYCTVFGGAVYNVSIRNNWMSLADGASSVVFDGTNISSGEISNNIFYGDSTHKSDVANVSPHILFNNNRFTGTATNLSSRRTVVSSFLNSWVAGARTPGYRKQGNFVYLTGQVTSGTNGATAFTLPSGFYPTDQAQLFSIIGGNTTQTGQLTVGITGNVVPNMSGGTTANLDGVVISL